MTKGFKKFIEKARTKSDEEKNALAFWGAFIITSFIFGIWLLNTIYTFQSSSNNNQENQASVFSGLIQGVQQIISNPEEVYQAK